MKSVVMLTGVILAFALNLFCQGVNLTPPIPSNRITSDFGPRNVTSGTPFHEGIDYCTAQGISEDFTAVEGGTITEIVWDGQWGSGWLIRVDGGTDRNWAYCHMFRTEVLPQYSPDSTIELRSATLVNPDDNV